MVAKGTQITLLFALEVTDDIGYASYRAGMRPILAAYGGRFGFDMCVSKVLAGAMDPGINRLFTIEFPSDERQQAFFRDKDYLQVREQWFDGAVGQVVSLGYVEQPG